MKHYDETRNQGKKNLNTKRNILCSSCFHDEGLRLEAQKIGSNQRGFCKNCGSEFGRKLNKDQIYKLSYKFFVWGSIHRCKYGGAPLLQFNNYKNTSIEVSAWLQNDIRIIEKSLGVGFFYYSPSLWMIGENERLEDLQDQNRKHIIIKRVIEKYPSIQLSYEEKFYRIRKFPKKPWCFSEYDSPLEHIIGAGRLESKNLPILYASKDLQLCLHECRVTAEDELFVATLVSKKILNFLDLTEIIFEETLTPFESLDIAIHMLFLAGEYSYNISKEIALAARRHGYDGILYPSYFSLLRTGTMPFQTTAGMYLRSIPNFSYHEKRKMIPNIAIFGYPIKEGKLDVISVNKIVLSKVEYDFTLGPVGHLEGEN